MQNADFAVSVSKTKRDICNFSFFISNHSKRLSLEGSPEMMNIFILAIFLIVNLLISKIYFKKNLNIPSKSKGILSKERKRGFQLAEAGIFVIFLYLHFFVLVEGNFPLFVRIAPIIGFFVLLNFNRGLELWMTDRDSKAYYHDWLAATIMSIFFAVLAAGHYL
jgi:hypothetical protein